MPKPKRNPREGYPDTRIPEKFQRGYYSDGGVGRKFQELVDKKAREFESKTNLPRILWARGAQEAIKDFWFKTDRWEVGQQAGLDKIK